MKIIDVPGSQAQPDGSVTTKQEAEVTLPRSELDRIWSPEYLERLARTYWKFLTRFFLGIMRVNYTEDGREITVLGIPWLSLLTFHKPEYETEGDCGSVTWRIKKGLLVAPAGRSNGYLQLVVKRPPADGEDHPGTDLVTGTVSSEVANFYPFLAGWGWFSRIGQHLYRITQLRIHILVTNAFLRSLARLDLAPSKVGALKTPPGAEVEEPAAR